jgi:hypothetical protein
VICESTDIKRNFNKTSFNRRNPCDSWCHSSCIDNLDLPPVLFKRYQHREINFL